LPGRVEREEIVLAVLADAGLTQWIAAQRAIWHWDTDPQWEVYGSDFPNLIELRFTPIWHASPLRRLPFEARLLVASGPVPEGEEKAGSPAIQVACDFALNLLELDSERRPNNRRHGESMPPPAPAALRVEELAELLLGLSAVQSVAEELVPELTDSGTIGGGECGLWVQQQSVALSQVIDLRGVRRNRGATDAADVSSAAVATLFAEDGSTTRRAWIADALLDTLVRSGYRGAEPLLESFRSVGQIPDSD
jgi:hypothetical protein